MAWQRVPFEQINEHSRIPSSINDSAKVKKKSPESILREYDVEKWGALTNLSQNLTIHDHSHLAERAHEGAGKRLCLLEDDLWLGSASEISKTYVERLVSILENIYLENNCDCIVEVGAGYGRILSPLVLSLGPKNIKKVYALDYTDAAIRILTNIFDGSDCDVVTGKIDLAGGDKALALPDWDHSLRPLVFSSQAIMYVPVLSYQFMGLMRYWRSAVFSFVEPSVFNLSASPLRSFQERYLYINDYNTNLAEILIDQKERGVIKNLTIEKNIISENAFLPLQRFDWRFS